jgi:predicted Holliday junction resolvase-like endonuclease
MTEIIIISLVALTLLYFILRKNSPSLPEVGTPQWKDDIAKKVRDIEDSTLLKQQLAQSQQEYTSALHMIGQLQYNVKQLNEQVNLITAAKIAGDEKFEKLQHQNKSSQVRTGAIGESLLPLHEEFPCDPKTLRLLGSPIDYISFCYETDKITFIEVKTGESQLNDNQKRVKRMVEEGKVEFKVVRLNEKGIKVK